MLDINSEIDRLRTAKHYSYMLASIVYYVYVLVVEKLLSAVERNKQTNKNCNRFLAER